MSRLYNKYIELKKEDSNKYYLFRSGNFYIFLSDDAKRISDITMLKCSNFAKDVIKCGFPCNSLDKYLNLFKNLNIDVFVIESDIDNKEIIINKIKNVDIDNTSPIKALNILSELKELVWRVVRI